jgi:hypothetical protein
VVYIEPYRKSLAVELHSDSIEETTKQRKAPAQSSPKPGSTESSRPKVQFRLFVGVAPRRFSALFEEKRDLKDQRADSAEPRHQDFMHSVSHLDLEKKISEKIAERVEIVRAQPPGEP